MCMCVVCDDNNTVSEEVKSSTRVLPSQPMLRANTNTWRWPTRRGRRPCPDCGSASHYDGKNDGGTFLWKLFVFVYSRLNLFRDYILRYIYNIYTVVVTVIAFVCYYYYFSPFFFYFVFVTREKYNLVFTVLLFLFFQKSFFYCNNVVYFSYSKCITPIYSNKNIKKPMKLRILSLCALVVYKIVGLSFNYVSNNKNIYLSQKFQTNCENQLFITK